MDVLPAPPSRIARGSQRCSGLTHETVDRVIQRAQHFQEVVESSSHVLPTKSRLDDATLPAPCSATTSMKHTRPTCADATRQLALSCVLGGMAAAMPQVSGSIDPVAELSLTAPFALPFVSVTIGDEEPRLIGLDTGATQVFLDRTWVDELGLDVTEIGVQRQPGGQVAIGRCSGVEMRLGGLPWTVPACGVVDMQPLEGAIGQPINGIIGFDLFRDFVVEIDYARGRVRLFDPQTYKYTGEGSVLDLTLVRTKPLVSLQITRFGWFRAERAVSGRCRKYSGRESVESLLRGCHDPWPALLGSARMGIWRREGHRTIATSFSCRSRPVRVRGRGLARCGRRRNERKSGPSTGS